MAGGRRNIFRAIVVCLFVASGIILVTSPTRYKVDLDSLMQIWGDVFRDVDSVVRTIRISTDLEIEFGDEIAAHYWSTGDDSNVQSYVTAVGEKVSKHARRQGIPWTFHVVSGGYPNAWAILGGHVYITEEMLDLIDSEAELAAILGHEIAHVDLHHCVDLVQNAMLLERVGMGSIGFILSMAEDFVRRGYSEVQEAEADRYGMLLAAKAGYSPLKAFDTFYNFYIKEEAGLRSERPTGGPEGEIFSSVSEALQNYFDTHPPFAERLDALRIILRNNAPGWEGRAFYIGESSHDLREAQPDLEGTAESRVFSENSADYLALRSELAFLLGRDREAIEFIDRLKLTFPEDERIDRLEGLISGQIEIQLSKPAPEPTVSRKTSTPSDDQSKSKAIEKNAWDNFEAGKYSEAIQGFEDAITRAPDFNRALSNLAWVYVAAGLPEYRDARKAIGFATRALEINEESADYDTIGAAYLLLGDRNLAREAYHKALNLEQSYAANLAKDLKYLGYLEGDTTDRTLRAVLEKALENGHAPFILSESVRRIKRLATSAPGQARHELEVISENYPDHPDIRRLLEEFDFQSRIEEIAKLWSEGKHEEAKEMAGQLLDEAPHNLKVKRAYSKIHFRLAQIAKNKGNTLEAILNYSEAIRSRNGMYSSALNNRALLYAKLGQLDEALSDIGRAIIINGTKSLYRANRCLFRRLAGQLEEALVDCEKAFKVGLPENRRNRSWVFLQRATVRRMLGDIDGSVADISKAMTYGEDSTVQRIQELMQVADLYKGDVDGSANPELLKALEACFRDTACFEETSRQTGKFFEFAN